MSPDEQNGDEQSGDDPRGHEQSGDEQGHSGLGIEAQQAVIVAEAERRGWKQIDTVSDEGASGKSLDRPGIERALGYLAAGDYEILVVSGLDRLSRRLLDFASLLARSEREGWKVIALDAGVDTSTAAGETLAGLLPSFADAERRGISERSSAAAGAAKRRGRRLGRPIATPPQVRDYIARAKAAGSTLQAIADQLNAKCIPTVSGKPWGTSSVQKVLLSVERDNGSGAAAAR